MTRSYKAIYSVNLRYAKIGAIPLAAKICEHFDPIRKLQFLRSVNSRCKLLYRTGPWYITPPKVLQKRKNFTRLWSFGPNGKKWVEMQ